MSRRIAKEPEYRRKDIVLELPCSGETHRIILSGRGPLVFENHKYSEMKKSIAAYHGNLCTVGVGQLLPIPTCERFLLAWKTRLHTLGEQRGRIGNWACLRMHREILSYCVSGSILASGVPPWGYSLPIFLMVLERASIAGTNKEKIDIGDSLTRVDTTKKQKVHRATYGLYTNMPPIPQTRYQRRYRGRSYGQIIASGPYGRKWSSRARAPRGSHSVKITTTKRKMTRKQRAAIQMRIQSIYSGRPAGDYCVPDGAMKLYQKLCEHGFSQGETVKVLCRLMLHQHWI